MSGRPLNSGHASGKAIIAYQGLITSITGALWVRSFLRWLYYSPFNLLSSLMTSEPGGTGRRGRSSSFLRVFLFDGLQRLIGCETPSRAGRAIVPAEEVPLEGASATLRGKGQMCQHLGFCPEIQPFAKNHSPPLCRGLAVRFGHLEKRLHRSCGGEHAPQISWHSLSIWVKMMQKSYNWISTMPPSLGVSFKEKRSGLISGEIANGEGQECAVQHAPK